MAAPMESSGDEVFGSLALFEEFSTTVESCKHRKADKSVAWDNEKNSLENKIVQLQQENILLLVFYLRHAKCKCWWQCLQLLSIRNRNLYSISDTVFCICNFALITAPHVH